MTSYLHGGRCQVGVLVFQFSVQGESTFVSVVGQEGGQVVDLTKALGTGLDWESFPAIVNNRFYISKLGSFAESLTIKRHLFIPLI